MLGDETPGQANAVNRRCGASHRMGVEQCFRSNRRLPPFAFLSFAARSFKLSALLRKLLLLSSLQVEFPVAAAPFLGRLNPEPRIIVA